MKIFQKLSAAAAVICLSATMALAYSEDTRSGADDTLHEGHSTFHYELTQVLARAAGFTAQDAQRIALASHGVDTFPTQMNTKSCAQTIADGDVNDGDILYVLGTVRSHDEAYAAQASYFHWPRRPDVNGYSQPYVAEEIDKDTCSYFGRQCSYEVSQLEQWAIGGNGSVFDDAPVDVPCSAEAGGKFETVEAGSLVALGIFLHSLGDSYSHQACMKAGYRTHQDSVVAECDSRTWHLEEEYGQNDAGTQEGAGVLYAYNASMAIYQALQTYITNNPNGQGIQSPSADSINLRGFVETFTQEDKSSVRSCIATSYLDQINAGDSVYKNSRSCYKNTRSRR